MKKLLVYMSVALLGLATIGCSGSDSSTTEAPPKGNMPETVNAPPGALNPEERGRLESGSNTSGEVDK